MLFFFNFFFPFFVVTKFITQTTALSGLIYSFLYSAHKHFRRQGRMLKGRSVPEHACPSRTIARWRCSQRPRGHQGISRPCRKLDLLGWVQLIHTPPPVLLPPSTCSLCCDDIIPPEPFLWWLLPQLLPNINPATPLYAHVLWSSLPLPCTQWIYKGIGENMLIWNRTKKLLSCFPQNHRSSLENKKTATMWCSEESWGYIWEYKFSQRVDFCLFYGKFSLSAPHMHLWAPSHTHNFFMLDHKISFPFSLSLCHHIFIFRMATLWPWRRERWSHCTSCGREWMALSFSGRKKGWNCLLAQSGY